jgi:hypothetical protein
VQLEALAEGVRLALMAVSEGLGECRLDVPYESKRPVITKPGVLDWCCTHDPSYCA